MVRDPIGAWAGFDGFPQVFHRLLKKLGGSLADAVRVIEYEDQLHRLALLDCIAQLQDHERAFDPDLLEGEAMAADYLALLQERCGQYDGRILLALIEEEVVGFVCVMAAVLPADPDDPRTDYAYVSDLFVYAGYRRRGVARTLLEAAEAFAKARGAEVMRVGVLAANAAARRLYEGLGFSPCHIQLLKPIS